MKKVSKGQVWAAVTGETLRVTRTRGGTFWAQRRHGTSGRYSKESFDFPLKALRAFRLVEPT